MHIFEKAHFAEMAAIFATALAMAVITAAPASAFTASGMRAAPVVPTIAVNIHDRRYNDRWNDDNDDEVYDDHHHRHHRHHHDDVVDAPFTHVESGHRVIVDAPFAHVAVGRYGRHIVAPFVDIWVPR
jgi:hypothetical protein